jgi:hypothetical protein
MRFLLLLAAPIIPALLQAEQRESARDYIGTKLKEEFRFTPPSQGHAVDTLENRTLVLEKITVTRPAIKWGLFEQVMAQKHNQRMKEETFTLENGGPFATKDFGKVRAQVGLWGEKGGFTFLKFRW